MQKMGPKTLDNKKHNFSKNELDVSLKRFKKSKHSNFSG